MSPIRYCQYQQWREVFIAGPTRNSAGVQGNDFPGFYYYDPTGQSEWVGVVDGPVDWRCCAFERRVENGRLRIGLASRTKLPRAVKLRSWRREQDVPPSQWTALDTLLTKSFQLLPLPLPPTERPRWRTLARYSLRALADRRTQVVVDRVRGYGAILEDVQDPTWRPTLELISQASLAEALLLARSVPGLEAGARIARRLARDVIPLFFSKRLRLFLNEPPPHPEPPGAKATVETWYLLSNLDKIMGILAEHANAALSRLAYQALRSIRRLAHKVEYIFPLYVDVTSGEPHGQLLNPSVLGIYAATMVRAAAVYPSAQDTVRAEASRALRVLRRLPVASLHHEPFQLSLATWAAAELYRHTRDSTYKAWANGFMQAALLNLYRVGPHAGLFQACAGILYPSFRETVESLMPLWNASRAVSLPMGLVGLTLAECGRFLSRTDWARGIPMEALPTTELSDASDSGSAIYGAGQVFDLARLEREAGPLSAPGA